MSRLSLFPLRTVLYPRGRLELRVFEPRYLDMVSRCLKNEEGFGVCLIAEGQETGPVRMHNVGTLARIQDWSVGADGLLQIAASGGERFRLLESHVEPDGLNVGDVEWLPDEPGLPVPERARPLVDILQQAAAQLPERIGADPLYEDASWVGYRLAELLPFTLPQRQYLLEISDAVRRLEIVETLVRSLAVK